MATEQRSAAGSFGRLTPEARRVIEHANGIRQRRSASEIHMEDLLAALFESGAVRKRFERAGYESRASLTDALGTALTAIDWTQVTPISLPSPPRLSRHAAEAIEHAAARTTAIDPMALLDGALEVPRCDVVRKLDFGIREVSFADRRANLAAVNDDAVAEDGDDLLDLKDYADVTQSALSKRIDGRIHACGCQSRWLVEADLKTRLVRS